MNLPGGHVKYDARREGRRRLVVGAAGVISMLLLVLLAGFLTDQARQEAEVARAQAQAAGVAAPETTATTTSSANEPLADPGIGDAPAAPRVIAPVPATSPTPTTSGKGGVVPDLQPDPELEPVKARR
jgi:predicted lipid-binding transport protein (Tim44 family)